MVGLRLARVDGFEPAIALGQDELPAYLRRFTMLFADDATMRRGGIGRVTRAVNAQGEAVALKQLILPARDESPSSRRRFARNTNAIAPFRALRAFPASMAGARSTVCLQLSWNGSRARRLPACVHDSPWTMPDACRRLWRRVWVATCSICSAV